MESYFISIVPDEDPENPMEYMEWKLISFNTRHSNFGDPAEHFTPEEFKKLQEENLAFMLSYYEHGPGTSTWQLRDAPHIPGSDCPWDSVQEAGILFYTGKKKDAPEEDQRFDVAKGVVSTYTDYLCGNVYCYDIDDSEGEMVDSCCGFYGTDAAEEALKEQMSHYGDDVEFDLDPGERNMLQAVPELKKELTPA